jgi:hypothetical protein
MRSEIFKNRQITPQQAAPTRYYGICQQGS